MFLFLFIGGSGAWTLSIPSGPLPIHCSGAHRFGLDPIVPDPRIHMDYRDFFAWVQSSYNRNPQELYANDRHIGPGDEVGVMKRRRRRVIQTIPLEQRLSQEARELRQRARKLPPCPEREALLRRARDNEITAHLAEWRMSPGPRAPIWEHDGLTRPYEFDGVETALVCTAAVSFAALIASALGSFSDSAWGPLRLNGMPSP